MTISNYTVKSIGNVVLDSVDNSNTIQHNLKTTFNHSGDARLADVQAVAPSANQVLYYNGSNLVAENVDTILQSVYSLGTDLISYNDSKYLQVNSGNEMTGDLNCGTNNVVNASSYNFTSGHTLSCPSGVLELDGNVVAFQNGSLSLGGNVLSSVGSLSFSNDSDGTNPLNFDQGSSSYTNGSYQMLDSNNYSGVLGSVYETQANLGTDVQTILTNGNYVTNSSQYIQSVQSGSVLSVSGSELDIDLSAYNTDSTNESKYLQISDQYIQSVNAPLSVSGNALSVDLSGYVASGSEYISSVGSNLSVSAGELNVDLSSYAQTSDLSGYVQNNASAPNFTASQSLTSSGGNSLNNKYIFDISLVASGVNTIQSISLASGKIYEIVAKFVANGSSGVGTVLRSGIYKLNAGSSTLVSSTDNSSVSGVCDGSELTLDLSSNVVNVDVQLSSSLGSSSGGCVVVEVNQCQ